ncbi:MAG: hypothetical protein NVSMB64_12370 [Candidatus Velthaea sp.]
MPDIRSLANAAGVRIELADLGDWGAATLVSEYDPDGPAIRINERAIDRYRAACGALSSCDVRGFIDLAIAHELYHHREATGQIARLPDRIAREAAAADFARAHVAIEPQLDAFLRAVRT